MSDDDDDDDRSNFAVDRGGGVLFYNVVVRSKPRNSGVRTAQYGVKKL